MRRTVFTIALVFAGWGSFGNLGFSQEAMSEKKEIIEERREMRYDERRFFQDSKVPTVFWPKFLFWNTSVQRQSDHTFDRAGYSKELSKLAAPSISHHYALGLVGGGKLIKGDGPAANGTDGIFGWDYVLFGRHPGRLFLGFNHDREHQMKNGPYNADKPRVFDVLTIRPVRRKILERQAEREGGGEE